MTFADILNPAAVKLLAGVTSKKRLMHDIAVLAETAYGLDSSVAVEALLERESLGPTGVGRGVALPHARVGGVTSVQGAFILLDRPIDFESVDRQPVDLIFALFAPKDAGVEHLRALALVSRTLRDPGTCRTLRSNPDATTLYTILTESPSVAAA